MKRIIFRAIKSFIHFDFVLFLTFYFFSLCYSVGVFCSSKVCCYVEFVCVMPTLRKPKFKYVRTLSWNRVQFVDLFCRRIFIRVRRKFR
jgi:hypothetical protein